MLIILSLLKRFWKPLTIITISGLLLFGAYFKGYYKAKHEMEAAAEREARKRFEDYVKEKERTDKVKEDIDRSRRSKPIDDKRDSCLLSSDPFERKCI